MMETEWHRFFFRRQELLMHGNQWATSLKVGHKPDVRKVIITEVEDEDHPLEVFSDNVHCPMVKGSDVFEPMIVRGVELQVERMIVHRRHDGQGDPKHPVIITRGIESRHKRRYQRMLANIREDTFITLMGHCTGGMMTNEFDRYVAIPPQWPHPDISLHAMSYEFLLVLGEKGIVCAYDRQSNITLLIDREAMALSAEGSAVSMAGAFTWLQRGKLTLQGETKIDNGRKKRRLIMNFDDGTSWDDIYRTLIQVTGSGNASMVECTPEQSARMLSDNKDFHVAAEGPLTYVESPKLQLTVLWSRTIDLNGEYRTGATNVQDMLG